MKGMKGIFCIIPFIPFIPVEFPPLFENSIVLSGLLC